MINDIGFNETLEWICKEFTIMNGIACRLITDGDEYELPAETKLDIFRICQEALNDIREEATATWVTITLKNSDESVLLVISDDGKAPGISETEKPAGLVNMRQLATAMNAELTVSNEMDKGKTITLSINKTWISKSFHGQRRIA
jgi:signal transduction histidine kinase